MCLVKGGIQLGGLYASVLKKKWLQIVYKQANEWTQEIQGLEKKISNIDKEVSNKDEKTQQGN